ncbi:hypothetical protein FACS1894211_05310 [Clostridia bacterium]|nr:hypothetical protein FACS1894211_05310 [Clostridia bacterium]
MARMESRSEQVAPQFEQTTISKYEDFGWLLQSTQEVVDNYLSSSRGNTYQNRSKYVKLMFQRDRDMQNYDAIIRLEREYDTQRAALPPLETAKAMTCLLWVMLCIPILWPISIPMLIVVNRKRKRMEKVQAEISLKLQPLRDQARQLL